MLCYSLGLLGYSLGLLGYSRALAPSQHRQAGKLRMVIRPCYSLLLLRYAPVRQQAGEHRLVLLRFSLVLLCYSLVLQQRYSLTLR